MREGMREGGEGGNEGGNEGGMEGGEGGETTLAKVQCDLDQRGCPPDNETPL